MVVVQAAWHDGQLSSDHRGGRGGRWSRDLRRRLGHLGRSRINVRRRCLSLRLGLNRRNRRGCDGHGPGSHHSRRGHKRSQIRHRCSSRHAVLTKKLGLGPALAARVPAAATGLITDLAVAWLDVVVARHRIWLDVLVPTLNVAHSSHICKHTECPGGTHPD
eukprot:3443490-Prymnesium_polylepis.2